MRQYLRFGWAAALGLAVGGAATAQVGTNTGSGAGSGLPTTLPTGLPGASGSGTGGATGTGGGGSLSAAPTITGMTTTTTNQGVLNQSNILGTYYANPYFQGRAGSDSTTAPGGFGTALYGTASTGSGGFPTGTGTSFGRTTSTSTGFGSTGSTGFGSTTGFGGTTGRTGSTGFGGTSGRTSFGGSNSSMTSFGGTGGSSASTGLPGGQVIQLPSQIAYSAVVRLPSAAPPPSRMTTEIKTMLDRSTVLSNPQGIQVFSNGPVVTLRGAVSSPDEARLIEGMVRLTPGVRDVLNELQYPAPPQP